MSNTMEPGTIIYQQFTHSGWLHTTKEEYDRVYENRPDLTRILRLVVEGKRPEGFVIPGAPKVYWFLTEGGWINVDEATFRERTMREGPSRGRITNGEHP